MWRGKSTNTSGIPPSFTAVGHYIRSGQLQLPCTSVVEEFKVAKCRVSMILRDSRTSNPVFVDQMGPSKKESHMEQTLEATTIPHRLPSEISVQHAPISCKPGQVGPEGRPTVQTVREERHTCSHILAGCHTAPTQGRDKWRHDKVLTVMADILEQARKRPRHQKPQAPQLHLIQAGEQPISSRRHKGGR